MNIDALTVGEARELARLFGKSQQAEDRPLGLQIVILDRGFIYVGNCRIECDFCIIENAKNVRRWGTSKGLGELAEKGPLKNTDLDPAGVVRAPMRAVIAMIACKVASWS